MIVATTGSTDARMDAVPFSTYWSPQVYTKYGSTVLTRAKAIVNRIFPGPANTMAVTAFPPANGSTPMAAIKNV